MDSTDFLVVLSHFLSSANLMDPIRIVFKTDIWTPQLRETTVLIQAAFMSRLNKENCLQNNVFIVTGESAIVQ